MENQIGLSKVTVLKVMQELKDFFLVEEKKQGLNKPNKIYLLSPVISDDENPTPYLDPETDYDPDAAHDYDYETENGGGINPTFQEVQELNPRTQRNYTAGSIETVPPKVQNLYPNDNKLINNKKKNNNMIDNKVSKTASVNSGEADEPPPATAVETDKQNQSTPYSKILEMYNALCETSGLRPIRSINGNRKTQTAARFKEYGINGFTDLFEKVSASHFLCGSGDRGWKVDYDWLIAPTNMQKVLEGKYDNENSLKPHTNTSGLPKQETTDPFLNYARREYENAIRHD